MKKITKTLTMYTAFDGKEFLTEAECIVYENNLLHQIPTFDVNIPFTNDGFAVYYIDSQENLNVLVAYLEKICNNVYFESYEKPQLLFVCFHGDSWAEIHTLDKVMQQLTNVMDSINNNTREMMHELRKENK